MEKRFVMEKNLEESNIIIDGENLLDKFENECKEAVEKYGDTAKGYEIAYMINGKAPDESKKYLAYQYLFLMKSLRIWLQIK